MNNKQQPTEDEQKSHQPRKPMNDADATPFDWWLLDLVKEWTFNPGSHKINPFPLVPKPLPEDKRGRRNS